MSADLGEQLRRLADEAAVAGDGMRSAADLWSRGRRRYRARVLSAAVSVVLLALLTGLGGSAVWSRMAAPQPAGPPGSGMRLPDHLYTPGAWLAEVDGPIGPLVAVVGAERRGWPLSRDAYSSNGFAGVSARTGEYRFLDLPGRATEAGAAVSALSADGRRLAYAIADERFDDQRLGGPGRVAGVAVYDSVTGDITTHRVESRLGLYLRGLAWAGTTLWFDYFGIDEVRGDGFSSSGGGTFRWSFSGTGAASGEPQLLPGTERIAPSSRGAAPGGFIVGVGQRDYRVVVKDTVSHAFRLDADVEGAPALSPDSRTVVGLGTSDPSTSDGTALPIMAGTLPATGAFDRGLVHLRTVPGVTAHEVLGWRDATHVVAMTYDNQTGPRIDSIDVGTGAVLPLAVFSGTNWMPGKIVAADAWSAPVVAVTEPHWPPDPRPFAGAALLVALAGAGYLLRRRRRGRA